MFMFQLFDLFDILTTLFLNLHPRLNMVLLDLIQLFFVDIS